MLATRHAEHAPHHAQKMAGAEAVAKGDVEVGIASLTVEEQIEAIRDAGGGGTIAIIKMTIASLRTWREGVLTQP